MLIKYAQFEREGERNTKVSKANANHPRNTRRGCKVYMSKNENKVRLVIPLKLPGRVKKKCTQINIVSCGGVFFSSCYVLCFACFDECSKRASKM